MAFCVPEKYRLTEGPMASDASLGNNGAFLIPVKHGKRMLILQIIAAQGAGWEHVSVRTTEMPAWSLMCMVKDLFWGPDDCVVQYHPPADEYVNNHPYVLHLWRPMDQEIPRPPLWLVGGLSPQKHIDPVKILPPARAR